MVNMRYVLTSEIMTQARNFSLWTKLRITHVRDSNLTDTNRIYPNEPNFNEYSEVPKCVLPNSRHDNRELTLTHLT